MHGACIAWNWDEEAASGRGWFSEPGMTCVTGHVSTFGPIEATLPYLIDPQAGRPPPFQAMMHASI